MKKPLLPALALLLLAGCPAPQPFSVSGSTPPGDKPATAAADPATTAAASADPGATKADPAASADAAATKAASPTPKPATPTPTKAYETEAFRFKYPTTWKLDREEKSPTVLHLTSPGGAATFEVKETSNFGTLDDQRKASVQDVGPGLVSNDATKLDLVSGFTVVGNVTTSAGSRFTTYRGYVYRYNLWRLTSQVDRKAATAAAAQKDIDAMVASWFWQ